MPQPNFNQAAQWVHQRRDLHTPSPTAEREIAEAIATLHTLAGNCKAAMLLPDLFPNVALETVFVPNSNSEPVTRGSTSVMLNEATGITGAALTTIGNALVAQLMSTGNDMAHYEFDDGAQAIAYLPEARDIVLRATGLVLLNG